MHMRMRQDGRLEPARILISGARNVARAGGRACIFSVRWTTQPRWDILITLHRRVRHAASRFVLGGVRDRRNWCRCVIRDARVLSARRRSDGRTREDTSERTSERATSPHTSPRRFAYTLYIQVASIISATGTSRGTKKRGQTRASRYERTKIERRWETHESANISERVSQASLSGNLAISRHGLDNYE